jgi:type IV secretion system protein VirB11
MTAADLETGMLIEYLKPLRSLLDGDVTEVCVNRPGEAWTESREGWKRYQIDMDGSRLMQLARLIATANKKAISEHTPILSAALPTGERVQIVIPPAAAQISITIRKPSEIDKTLEELEAEGSFDQAETGVSGLKEFEIQLQELLKAGEIRRFLELAVATHRNLLICGKTGSGKTTITRSLSGIIPKHERLITIEDVHELFLRDHPNKVHLFYGRDQKEGVNAKQALASCLRMKPDRILLAELRGDESWDYIKSINTGHPGSITTMHANGAFEAFDQLTALVKDSPSGAHLDTTHIRQRLISTIDVVLFYSRWKLKEVWFDPELKYRCFDA